VTCRLISSLVTRDPVGYREVGAATAALHPSHLARRRHAPGGSCGRIKGSRHGRRTRDRLDGTRSGLGVLARDVRRGVHIRSELLLAIAGALHGEEHGPI